MLARLVAYVELARQARRRAVQRLALAGRQALGNGFPVWLPLVHPQSRPALIPMPLISSIGLNAEITQPQLAHLKNCYDRARVLALIRIGSDGRKAPHQRTTYDQHDRAP